MDALRIVAIGLVVVAVDLRVDGVDLVTDGIGWPVALFGLLSLSALHAGFRAAAAAAALGLAAWAADPWLGVDPDLAAWGDIVAQTGVVFATCTALMALVPEKRVAADRIRWADLGLSLLAALVGTLLAGEQGVSAPLVVLLLVVPALVVYVCFLVLLFRCAPLMPRPPVTTPVG